VRIFTSAASSSSSSVGDHRQAADELGDQAELDQVFRLDFRQDLAHVGLALGSS
jgi:hypothetical protein